MRSEDVWSEGVRNTSVEVPVKKRVLVQVERVGKRWFREKQFEQSI